MTAPGRRIARVVIVGGGTAGWMAAAALSHGLKGTAIAIELVESEAIGTVGVGESTLPHIRHFNQTLGIDEAGFLKDTNATIKLGIEFRNWARKGDSYIHPFGDYGHPDDPVNFHHHWLRLGGEAAMGPIDDYSLPIQMARRERFARPSMDMSSLLSTFSYAYQFDAALYARFLRSFSEARGVKRTEGRVVDVALDGESGFVTAITLENGTRIEGDLFVDCSGFRGLIIEQALKAGYEDWSHWLPCDRAIALPSASTRELPPYTRATAQEAGWCWRIPLQHRVGNGHVYASAFMDDARAEDILMDALENTALAEPNRLRFLAGKRRQQWSKNCVAIGLASGFLEPLESTSIHLIQVALGYLLDFFPTGAWDPADADEFNHSMSLEYERVRDFLILHYHATERDDTPFWDYCRTMDIPDSLTWKMELFRERGVPTSYEYGVFLPPSWIAVYIGQRIAPRRFDPLAQAIPEDAARARFARLKAEIAALADTLPHHGAAIGMTRPPASAAG
ncbi:tryptophan 7-halogenase [Alkalicaulis satelles]|uniref:Tryptophan 7-halogenase n=1 Tax=Alkalicaulis satelles TaxID=2609175 RepID=A0A5M6ZJQ9_9PROT|nr:tryptophan halogenase family protein [Alkalicaulis satelles]KAA5805043.1 tryptophan 7-halogenase [Alkalicaulis satelles]